MAGDGGTRVAVAVFAAQLRDRPLRLAVAVVAIAVGIALTAGVYLLNESALAEFGRATRELAGTADLAVRGGRGGFAETLYAELARRPEVRVASPVVERDVSLAGGGTLLVRGIDPFVAGALQPALYASLASHLLTLFEPDAIALSARAAEELGVSRGGGLAVRVGDDVRALRVVLVLPEVAYAGRLGIMDIGSAQWTLGALGRLDRVDLALAPGIDAERFRATLVLPAGVDAVTPSMQEGRATNLTRAYRVNLDMLALVALLTGAFVVFASQALAVMRRRQQLALLRALGVRRFELRLAVLVEAALIGAAGGALGTGLGWLVARVVLATLGADLGAGLFDSAAVPVVATPLLLAAFVGLGVLVAVAGAWLPASRAAGAPPARALRAGDAESPGEAGASPTLAVGLLAAGGACAFGPPLRGLPLFGYAAIALLLLGAVLLVPAFVGRALAGLPTPRRPLPGLVVAKLREGIAQSAVSLAAIVVSFSLMVAMAIMVHSFRDSFDRWLGEVLPADIYLRIGPASDTTYLTAGDAAGLATLPGIARAELRRSLGVSLAPERPPVMLIARPLAGAAAGLPLVERAQHPDPALPPAYVSEAMRDLYGAVPGGVLELPIGGVQRRFVVAGVWRDYARSNGTVVIERSTFEALAGEQRYTEGGVWLAPHATLAGVAERIRALLPYGPALQLIEAGELKRRSLAAFDRAFAITYALEAVAVGIGLLGVGFAFAIQGLARRAEFGMLRHVGLRRRDVVAMLAGEGALLGAVGALYGLLVGVVLSLVLVYAVNRQSFHWSLDYVVPLGQLTLIALVLVASSALTARVAGRLATGDSAVRAVREDW